MGVSERAIFRWQRKFAAMGVVAGCCRHREAVVLGNNVRGMTACDTMTHILNPTPAHRERKEMKNAGKVDVMFYSRIDCYRAAIDQF